MRRPLLTLAGALLLATASSAQLCNSGTETFLKNDTLPQIPGASTVSVIQGLCEDEAAGCVFDVSGLGAPVQINKASVGYVNIASASGITAAVNLVIYDGISWSGGLPTLGPVAFNFGVTTGASIQLTSSGINEVDISPYNVTVSSGTAVVTWEMEFNTGGSCPTGYQTNYATDFAGGGGGCSPAQKNLIFITGQGWRDVTTAKIGPGGFFDLCPQFYAGNWIIRICAEGSGPVGPVNYCTAGTSAAGCIPALTSSGTASASAGAGFLMIGTGVEGSKDGLFFFGQNGRQANSWGSGTSYQCVVPPVSRAGLLSGGGVSGTCSGAFIQDLNARWCAACPKPSQQPTPGTRLQVQLWYRDPMNTSNQTTSLSDAHEVDVSP
jgi:hypothetical protein